jgi:Trm5-related predicted tRNA methylase
MNIESVSPLKKDGTPKKKTGRPSNAEKPLGQADLTKMARRLGKVTDEALDIIIDYMQKKETPEKEKVRIATQIVGTVQALISQVDRQTLMKKNLAMLDAKMQQEKIEMPVDDGQDNGLEQPSATIFTFDIVQNNQ